MIGVLNTVAVLAQDVPSVTDEVVLGTKEANRLGWRRCGQ